MGNSRGGGKAKMKSGHTFLRFGQSVKCYKEISSHSSKVIAMYIGESKIDNFSFWSIIMEKGNKQGSYVYFPLLLLFHVSYLEGTE